MRSCGGFHITVEHHQNLCCARDSDAARPVRGYGAPMHHACAVALHGEPVRARGGSVSTTTCASGETYSENLKGRACALSQSLDLRSSALPTLRSWPLLASDVRALRPPGASSWPSRWPRPPEKRGWRCFDVLAAGHLLAARCGGPTHSLQSGRSAPTLNPLSCSVTCTEPPGARALRETAESRFCDCQRVRRPRWLAVVLSSRCRYRAMMRDLQV